MTAYDVVSKFAMLYFEGAIVLSVICSIMLLVAFMRGHL